MKHKSERRGAKNLPGGNLIRKSTGRFGTPGILRVGSIIHAWTASTLTSLWSKKRPENGLSRKEMETLLTTAAHKVVNVAKCDAATNGAKWRVVPAVLELKIESPHGGVGKAMEALNFLFGGTLPLRTVNKRTQMVRGYISYQTGEPAEISLLRKEPKILRKFNFKKFFAALKTCGSEKAFLEKYCDVPAKLSARTPDEDEPVVDSRFLDVCNW